MLWHEFEKLESCEDDSKAANRKQIHSEAAAKRFAAFGSQEEEEEEENSW
jgi:hypothetical protein